MNINTNSKSVFGAKFLSNVSIKKYNKDEGKYCDVTASVVELDATNPCDVKAVGDATHYWENDSYGCNIAYSLKTQKRNPDTTSNSNFFALTLQNSNFDNLDTDNIQGLAEIKESDSQVKISYLQVNPEHIYCYGNPQYKHIGKSLVETLQDKYNDKTIILSPVPSAVKFYEKLNFKISLNDMENTTYYWKK